MKIKKGAVILVLLIFALGTFLFLNHNKNKVHISEANIAVLFSPRGGCTEAIVEALQNAKESIYIQAYSFTSVPIAQAIVAAQKRNVHVEIILDKSQQSEKYSSADFVSRAGISTYIDSAHSIAHNKVMIIDDKKVITGSFNFTKSAEQSNAENLLIIESPSVARVYLSNWKEHKKHSQVYVKK